MGTTRESWKRLSPDERRAQLIAIAEQLFQTRPYTEIGIVDVAKAAGITHGLIYHYFASKEALFTAAFEDRARQLLDACSLDSKLPVLEYAVKGIRGYLDFVESHRIAYLNIFRGPVAGHTEFIRICEETRRTIMDRFIAGIGGQGATLPATRLALRGYLGFAESAVLDWLENHTVPRAALERLILAALSSSLRSGLSLDAEAQDRATRELFTDFEAALGRHFALPPRSG